MSEQLEFTVEEARRGGYIPKQGGKSKYGNTPTVVNGIRFDSKREAGHWQELLLRQSVGEISGLRRQVRFALEVSEQLICTYVADFTYSENGKMVVADSKGAKTREYILKKKLMRACWDIEIVEL